MIILIIRERKDEFVMIQQHDHASISGDIAKHLRKEFFMNSNIEEVVIAAYEHDRSWIALDDTAMWNDQTHVPYSFMDYPLLPKLALYKLGLDEIEKISKYACLISSLHYSSFFKDWVQPECIAFIERENLRQKSILDLVNVNEETISLHLKILQFCDRLSLYVCLNEPGVEKKGEHSWYREGISYSEFFSNKGKNLIFTQWIDEEQISVSNFPFDKVFQTRLRYKTVSKESINNCGIDKAYKKADFKDHLISFCK